MTKNKYQITTIISKNIQQETLEVIFHATERLAMYC